ncbi:hypothetical protein [Embleya sp. NPDC005971]|uniref:hypothetical protein n=1 Tax=Embleya sp. NPDC005971 TaxID=3156724 RepID=UPI0033EBEF32
MNQKDKTPERTPRAVAYEVRACDEHAPENCDGEWYTLRGIGTKEEAEHAAKFFVHAWIVPRD